MRVKPIWQPETMVIGGAGYSRTSHPRIYYAWRNMFKRCYDPIMLLKYPSYVGCSVDIRWHNFQNFAVDLLELNSNYGEIKSLCLDKDLKMFGNKVYSKSRCLVIHNDLNVLFGNAAAIRGDLPIGIQMNGNNYEAQCSSGKNVRKTKTFKTLHEAVQHYWLMKAERVQNCVESYPEFSKYIKSYFTHFILEHT